MFNFGTPSNADLLAEVVKNNPAVLQMEALEEQTAVMKQNAEMIDRLNNQVSALQQQLKEESENNAIALKKERRFTICCSLLTGITGTILGTIVATVVINIFF